MKDFKLNIELLPKGAWGNDFSRTLKNKDWDFLRQECYKRAKQKCVICGYKTDKLDAHEVWDFDKKTKTQTLLDIIALCSRCHGVKHFRNSQRKGFGENAKRHFINVNKCTEMEFAAHLTTAQINFEQLNNVFRWKMVADLKKFGGREIEIHIPYIPLINNPYSQEELKNSKNEVGYTPRLLDVVVNNYEGTIVITCDKTNKIDWYDDKLNILQTKYCFGGTFITKFSVKDLLCPYITFRLTGECGKKVSKKFHLETV